VNEIIKQEKKLFNTLVEPFRSGDGFDIGLVIVFLLINSIVCVNAFFHDPGIGYDAGGHLRYIQTLSELRLVTPPDSREFFSPPLPYAIPALLMTFTGIKLFWAAKLAQCLNVLLSLGLTFYLIKACRLISSKSALKLGALVFLGILPVYYKTFAFVRGEPYVAFFTVMILYYTLLVYKRRGFSTVDSTILAVLMGLCALSRQWGFLFFPAVFLLFVFQWICYPRWRSSIIRTICLCLVFITVISGWFYMSLHSRYGSFTAFNRQPAAQFSFGNQPLEFYLGLSPELLFNKPVRPNFPNQFLPIFYSELWGDYWGYFTVYGRDIRTSEFLDGYSLNRILSNGSCPSWLDTNYETIGDYLGRVNLVSIFPSALALISLVMVVISILQRRCNNLLIAGRREVYAFLLLAIGTIISGYIWFLVLYPSPGKGDTIKATYVLQVFPLIAIMVGTFLEQVKRRSQLFFRLILGGLCFCLAHNIFAVFTHFSFHYLR